MTLVRRILGTSTMSFPKVMILTTALILAVASVLGCQRDAGVSEAEPGVGVKATAEIVGTDTQSMGLVTLTQGPQGVLVSADLSRLPPGGHGFHIHAVGSCTPDFSAAGGHFGPGEESHGFMYSTDKHAGDLPNIYASADGTARADTFTADVTLAVGDERSLFDSDGSAIVIHEKPDAYGEDSGTAGARIACGVIRRN